MFFSMVYFLRDFDEEELLPELDFVVPLLLDEPDPDLIADDELLEDVLPDLTEPELAPRLLTDFLVVETLD
jgi:hypothetical protein